MDPRTNIYPTGFIGSAVTRQLFARGGAHVCVVGKLTHAGNLASLQPVAAGPRFSFIKADICDAAALRDAFARAWGPIASCTARRERGDPQAALVRHKAPAPECPGARRKPALDGETRVRYMFHVALYGALRLDIVDIYRRFRLVSLARKSIAGRVSRIPPSPELPSTELPSPKLRAAHGFCARLRLNARAWFSAGDRETT